MEFSLALPMEFIIALRPEKTKKRNALLNLFPAYQIYHGFKKMLKVLQYYTPAKICSHLILSSLRDR